MPSPSVAYSVEPVADAITDSVLPGGKLKVSVVLARIGIEVAKAAVPANATNTTCVPAFVIRTATPSDEITGKPIACAEAVTAMDTVLLAPPRGWNGAFTV